MDIQTVHWIGGFIVLSAGWMFRRIVARVDELERAQSKADVDAARRDTVIAEARRATGRTLDQHKDRADAQGRRLASVEAQLNRLAGRAAG